MAGGATGGYCAIGSLVMDTAPMTMTNSAITHAKMGRSMKNRDMVRSALLRHRSRGGRCRRSSRATRRHRGRSGGAAAGVPWHRLHRRAGTQFLESVDHHLLAGGQAREHDPLVVLRAADLDRARA